MPTGAPSAQDPRAAVALPLNIAGPVSQTALYTVLQDMYAERQKLEDQRLAMLNILEDGNEAQRKLREKVKYIETLVELVETLTQSTETQRVMEATIEAIERVVPHSVLTVFIGPGDGDSALRETLIASQIPIGSKYLQRIYLDSLAVLDTIRSDAENVGLFSAMLKQVPRPRFLSGSLNEKLRVLPSDGFVVPMIVRRESIPTQLIGLFHISSTEPGWTYSLEQVQSAYDVVQVTADNVGRIRTLIMSEHSRIADLVTSMSNGVMMFDVNRRIVIANPVAQRLTPLAVHGTSVDEVLRDVPQSMHGSHGGDAESTVNLSKHIDRVLSKGENIHLEEVQLRGRTYEMFLTPVRDYRHVVSGGAIIVHDITHIKEVDRMKTEFVTIASHQLRTPLSAINWYIEMLQAGDAGPLTDEQKEYLNEVYEGSRRMGRLVNDLLNVSRIESGRLKIEPKETDIIALLQDVAKEVEPLAKDHGIPLVVDVPKDAHILVRLDPTLYRQVVHNFATNAIRYTPHTKPDACVTISFVERGGEYVVSVTDTGIGIPFEARPRLFEKFFRADNARESTGDGTGLGLYISKMIMEISGGRLWYESVPGQGTTFFAALPKKGMCERKGERSLAK